MATASNWGRRIARGLKWLGFALGVLLALVVSAALAGAAYEAVASGGDAGRYPPPGRLVDVEGRRLHLNCAGTGSPVVILDSGLGGTSLDWAPVETSIAKITRVCSWDRAGMGWSDPGPLPRTPKRIADDLHRLLAAAHVPGPYVLVGHSLAGKTVRMFALAHRTEAAGMVLVDARSEYMDFHLSPEEKKNEPGMVQRQTLMYRVARRLGVVRLFGASLTGAPPLSRETRDQMAHLATEPKQIDATVAELRSRAADDVALRDAPSLSPMPLVVLASGENMQASADWRKTQAGEAHLSSNSRFEIVQDSGHYIQWKRPDRVLNAIREVVTKVRAGS